MALKQKPKQKVHYDVGSLVERLLGQYELWPSGKDEWRCVCPFHTKGSKRRSEFRIKRSGYWKCFSGSCGKEGSIIDLVMGLEKLDYIRAQEWLADAPRVFARIEDVPELPPYKERFKEKPKYETLPESAIALYKKNCPVYLLERGFTEQALLKYEIGYSKHKSRIVIPTRDVHGKLVGITLRLDFDSDGPKYWHDHFDKSLHLYGFHLWARKQVSELYLVEGQLDVVRMWQLGKAACAVMGSSISDEQVALLKEYAKCDKLVLMFDNDDAGQFCTLKTRNKLSRSSFGRKMYIAKYQEKDPGELNRRSKIELVPWWKEML